jgi:hypothetical protein
VAHRYNLRQQRRYRERRLNDTKTRPTPVSIGERRRPDPQGQPGYLRLDTVHQGDAEGLKGVYHTPPTQFGRVPLYPPPNRNVIHVHASLCHDLFQVSQAQRISKIATNAQNNDLGFECDPLNTAGRSGRTKRQACQKRPSRICNTFRFLPL